MFGKAFSQVACGLVFVLMQTIGHAGSFAVNPLRVTLSMNQSTDSLTVRNESTDPAIVQLELMEWSQDEGADVLTTTHDILATPPIFTIPPGGSQVVRVGMRRPPDPTVELTYRLLLRELPPPPDEGFQGLRMALNISLPVFILPLATVTEELHWAASLQGQTGFTLSVKNSGNAHVQVANFKLAMAGGAGSGPHQVAEYVLAGQSREWLIDESPPADGVVLLTAETDAGELQAEIKLPAPEPAIETGNAD